MGKYRMEMCFKGLEFPLLPPQTDVHRLGSKNVKFPYLRFNHLYIEV
jgi:hypothetical protein